MRENVPEESRDHRLPNLWEEKNQPAAELLEAWLALTIS